jgi:hypothetical protein
MARVHLFEWEDQPWLPHTLRDIITDHLRYSFSSPQSANLRRTITSILAGPLRRSGATKIVDVCSGGGGPLPALVPGLAKIVDRPLTATLTDLFPNASAFARTQSETNGAVRGELTRVSAFDVPADLGRFQTLFTALHHFRPEDAKRILRDAAAKGRVIAIIEPFKRADLLMVLIASIIFGFLRTPWVGPLIVKRFLLTYVLPLSPFVLAWYGAVSCLRAYTAGEMEAMGREVAPLYRWTSGVEPIPGAPGGLAITYLIGEPPEQAGQLPEAGAI